MPWSLVQKSASTGGGPGVSTVTPALPGASAAGNLLVAFIDTAIGTDTITGPSGWTLAVQSASGFSTPGVSIWALLNNPGGITSASFTDSGAAMLDAYMAEFTGPGVAGASADQSGSAVSASNVTSLNVSASSVTAGDLAVCFFAETETSAITFTTPSGWTLLESSNGTATGLAPFAAYLAGTSAGTLSVTCTSGASKHWAGAVATFTPGAGSSALVRNPLIAGQAVMQAATF